jgi:hypothetical protein
VALTTNLYLLLRSRLGTAVPPRRLFAFIVFYKNVFTFTLCISTWWGNIELYPDIHWAEGQRDSRAGVLSVAKIRTSGRARNQNLIIQQMTVQRIAPVNSVVL